MQKYNFMALYYKQNKQLQKKKLVDTEMPATRTHYGVGTI